MDVLKIERSHEWERTEYRPARNQGDREAAFRLIYRRYVESGLMERNSHELRVTPFQLLPTTTVFVGTRAGMVFGTVTLIADGSRGLPIEAVYAKEIADLRAAGLAVAEVSCLAIHDGNCKRQVHTRFLELNRLMAQYARFHGIDALVIATHPRHASYYRRLMGFEQIGAVSSYPSVRNHPAVACCLEFAKVDECPPPAYDAIFGTRIPPRHLHGLPMTLPEQAVLGPIAALYGQSVPLAVA